MDASPIAACLEQVVPKLYSIKEPYTLPGQSVEELYGRLVMRREDPDINAICDIFERFLELDDHAAMEIIVIFEKYLMHQHMPNAKEL